MFAKNAERKGRKVSMYKREEYPVKGRMIWIYNNDGTISHWDIDYDNVEKEMHSYPIYDLMSGKEFYEDVDSGGFIDYDGIIANVFINGYDSNLGLYHRGICQGDFIVNGDTWLEICEEFNVEVNWANR